MAAQSPGTHPTHWLVIHTGGGRAARARLGVQLHVRLQGRAVGGAHLSDCAADDDGGSNAGGDLRAYPHDGSAVIRAHDGHLFADSRANGHDVDVDVDDDD